MFCDLTILNIERENVQKYNFLGFCLKLGEGSHKFEISNVYFETGF